MFTECGQAVKLEFSKLRNTFSLVVVVARCSSYVECWPCTFAFACEICDDNVCHRQHISMRNTFAGTECLCMVHADELYVYYNFAWRQFWSARIHTSIVIICNFVGRAFGWRALWRLPHTVQSNLKRFASQFTRIHLLSLLLCAPNGLTVCGAPNATRHLSTDYTLISCWPCIFLSYCNIVRALPYTHIIHTP